MAIPRCGKTGGRRQHQGGAIGIIGWIILGLIAGAIARAIVPGDQPGGLIVSMLVGILGAVAAGFTAQALGFGDPIDEFWDLSTWVAAIIGAVVLLVIWGALTSGGSRRRDRPT